jgi:hypothetical protein
MCRAKKVATMLTADERRVIAQYLAQGTDSRKLWLEVFPYLFPPVVFAIFGIWQRDFAAVALAFVVLLALAIWYLARQHDASQHFYTALRKYEGAVQALKMPESKAN